MNLGLFPGTKAGEGNGAGFQVPCVLFNLISFFPTLNKLDISLSVSMDLANSLKPGIGFYNVRVSCSVMSDSL